MSSRSKRFHLGDRFNTLARACGAVVESLEHRCLLTTTYTQVDTFQAPTPDDGQLFGMRTASNGTQVLVGAIGANNGAGEAYLFNSDGTLAETFVNPNPNANDQFGASVAFAGTDILIGAPGDSTGVGVVYLFDNTGTLLHTFNNPANNTSALFGANVAFFDGDVLIYTHNDNGYDSSTVRQYTTSGTLVQTYFDGPATSNDGFGGAMAVSGSTLLIGAYGSGKAFLYDNTGTLLETFVDPSLSGVQFGVSVGFIGTDVAIGDSGYNGGEGAVYRMSSTNGSLIDTYENPNPESAELFGTSIAFIGNDIVIGASQAKGDYQIFNPDTQQMETARVPFGAVYVIDIATGALEAEIANPTQYVPDEFAIDTFDFFGDSVAVAGGKIFIGDDYDNATAVDAGTIFVFEPQTSGNQAPTADAGTYSSLNENGSVMLTAAGSTDPDGGSDIVSYAWDLDNDGQYDDATGQTVNFSKDAAGAYTVGVRVTDSANNTDTDTASVTFTDVAPTADGGADQTIVRNQTANFSGSGSNSAGDAITAYEWDLDNDGTFETTGQNTSAAFNTAGTFTVKFRVKDDDNQYSAADSISVTVQAAAVQGNDLVIGGTAGADDIDVNAVAGGLEVLFGGVVVGTYSPSGKIVIRAAEGNDDVTIASGVSLAAEVYGEAGNDTISGGSGLDTLLGGAGGDSLAGGAGNDSLAGEADNDTLNGGLGADVLSGGAGVNIADYSGRAAGLTITLDSGTNNDGDLAINEGDDVTGVNIVWGGSGADTITGTSSADTLLGNGGADVLSGGAGADSISGGGANDLVFGQGGNDTLLGGSENDSLSGGDDNDSIYGEDGDDTLDGGLGADHMDGDNGYDFADYSSRTAGVKITLDSGTNDDGDPALTEGDNVRGMNGAWGGSGNDTITGDATGETLLGGGGEDSIDGGSGNDSLNGEGANDTLVNGLGNDTLDGGDGDDFVDFRNATAAITISLNGDADDSVDGYTDNILNTIDSIIGSDYNDSIIGSSGNDTIKGVNGDDTIKGGNGDDSLVGGSGNDLIYGGRGFDLMYGSGGNDRFWAEEDTDEGDTVRGEGGTDTLETTDGSSIDDWLE